MWMSTIVGFVVAIFSNAVDAKREIDEDEEAERIQMC